MLLKKSNVTVPWLMDKKSVNYAADAVDSDWYSSGEVRGDSCDMVFEKLRALLCLL